ncbi:MAG: hypothetical protein H6574_19345 [Lewinellaceae bacterium]|nr:hypothetical protein [Saprospiraceae bacterium]MCB9333228.1 hypothetical protein [Lewinellaceae bacterium]
MKNGIFTLAFIAIILGTQCQESAPKSSDFNTQLSTEIGNLNTARQTVVDANNQVNDLRTELNNIPEDVKADPNSGFSELLRKVEIFESKTGAMLMMYDRVIPELTDINTNMQSGGLNAEQAQMHYDSIAPTIKNYATGAENTKKLMEQMREEAKRLAGSGN